MDSSEENSETVVVEIFTCDECQLEKAYCICTEKELDSDTDSVNSDADNVKSSVLEEDKGENESESPKSKSKSPNSESEDSEYEDVSDYVEVTDDEEENISNSSQRFIATSEIRDLIIERSTCLDKLKRLTIQISHYNNNVISIQGQLVDIDTKLTNLNVKCTI